jgi:hypothetical protein
MALVKPLEATALEQRCDPAPFTFETTAGWQDLNAVRVPLGSAIVGDHPLT